MKIFKCEKCGSMDVFIQYNETHCGLYCGDCGKWIKWLNKDEERLAFRQIDTQTEKKDIEATARADERRKFEKVILEIKGWLSSGNRGSCDYFILDKVEETITEYQKGAEE